MLTSETPKKTGIWSLPVEVMLLIFCELQWSNFLPPNLVGKVYPWFYYLRTMKSTILVCHLWSDLAKPSLYSFIYLHRIGHLLALVQTLQSDNGRLYGTWVQQLQIEFYVPSRWVDMYRINLPRLLELCPSVRIITHNPIWDFGLPYKPDLVFLDILDIMNRNNILPNLHEVATTRPILPVSGALLQSSFRNLKKLQIYIGSYPLAHNEAFRACLPNLDTLICEIPSTSALHNFEIISRYWTLPSLSHLQIFLKWLQIPSERFIPLNPILNLCIAHGANLLSFLLDNRLPKTMAQESLVDVLTYCPKLERLTYSYETVPVIRLPARKMFVHRSLQYVTFCAHIFISDATDESVHEHMAIFSARSTFPALRGFIFLDSRFSDLPLDVTQFADNFADVVRRWVTYAELTRLRLLNSSGHDVVLMQHTDNSSDEDEDEEDDSFLILEDDNEASFGEENRSNSDGVDLEYMETELDSGDETVARYNLIASPTQQSQFDESEALEIYRATLVNRCPICDLNCSYLHSLRRNQTSIQDSRLKIMHINSYLYKRNYWLYCTYNIYYHSTPD